MNNLAERCAEILEWRKTGYLHGGEGGVLRKYAETLTDIPEHSRINIAEHHTILEAMRYVVDHEPMEAPKP